MPDYRENDRRRVTARWILAARLEILTASQIGSQEGESSDQTFERRPDGTVVLPGSTLAGALRGALSARLGGHRAQEHGHVACLFGDTERYESPVIVFDSVSEKAAQANIRDGVHLDPRTGTAARRHKYDREVAAPGMAFPIRLDVVITEDLVDEPQVMRSLADALEGLSDGTLAFGARKSRGMGACRATQFRAQRYDLRCKEQWLAYAESDYRKPLKDHPSHACAADAINAAWPDGMAKAQEDRRAELRLDFSLQVEGTLLIRSPGQKPGDPDAIHLTEDGKRLLSGTSVAGALRAHALRIRNSLNDFDMLREPVSVSALFGPSPEEIRQGAPPAASRVLVSECQVEESETYRQSRVKIDRFTGGALETALFEEQPCVGGQVKLTVRVLDPSRAQMGLLALVARDLCQGLLPLGGGAAVGRGVMKGSVKVWRPRGRGEEDLTALESCVKDLVKPQEENQP